MGEASLGSFNLARARLASKLRGDLIDIRDSGCPQRMSLGEQAATGVDRNITTQFGSPCVNHPPGFPCTTQTQILVMQQFCCGKTIVELDQTQVLRPDTGFFIGFFCRIVRQGIDIGHGQVPSGIGVRGKDRSRDFYRFPGKLLHLVF